MIQARTIEESDHTERRTEQEERRQGVWTPETDNSGINKELHERVQTGIPGIHVRY